MTPIEQVEKLKLEFLDQVMSVFEDDDTIFSIEFDPFENEYYIEPTSLTRDGVLTSIDEFGNDYDEKLSSYTTEIIALILTQIQLKQYEPYERI